MSILIEEKSTGSHGVINLPGSYFPFSIKPVTFLKWGVRTRITICNNFLMIRGIQLKTTPLSGQNVVLTID